MYNLLKGVRVLDLSTVVLGPFATQYLGDFGADVIKVEPPTGDIFRYARPARSEDMGAGFLNLNRNKRSVFLDLKKADDLQRFQSLLDGADVLVHNMRPLAAARLGLTAQALQESHPKLVYCIAAGYGSGGRNADNPAYDDIIQAASGIAALNKGSQDEPRFVPTILCDKISGMHLAMAALAGIAHQAKTGKGCAIEAPMFEGMVAFLMVENLSGETYRPAEGTVGYSRLQSPNRRPHATKDSFIGALPYDATHWTRILEFIGSDLAEAEWIQSSSQRSARVDELYAALSAAMPARTTSDWLEIFTELDIPCTPVNDLQDLLTDAHLQDVGMFKDAEHPTEGKIRTVRSPFWVEGVELSEDTPVPRRDTSAEPITWHEKSE